jgi:IclR family acetate operon transcriptional repressor
MSTTPALPKVERQNTTGAPSRQGSVCMANILKSASGGREASGPRSLTRVLGLFDALARSKDGLSLAELNVALKSPKSSLLNLLRPLVTDGYLNCENGRYRLGASIFRLAGNIMSVWNFSSAYHRYLQELAARSQESVYMGVLDAVGKSITYVDAIESPHSVRFSVPIGAVRPLYPTAAGRVLLAFADPAWLEEYLRTTKFEAHTPTTIATRTALRAELDQIRRTHISVSLGELFAESAAISAPVFGADGKIIGAMAIGAPVTRLEPRLAELRPIIAEIAARASGATRAGAQVEGAATTASAHAAPRRRGAAAG